MVNSESVPSENMLWVSTYDTTAKTLFPFKCISLLFGLIMRITALPFLILTKHLEPMIVSFDILKVALTELHHCHLPLYIYL